MRKYKELLIVCIVALLVRLPLLNSSLWLDEAGQALESVRPLSQQYLIADDFQPPLLHYIVHFMLQVSRDEWWIRTSSLAAGLGTIIVVYLLIEKKFDKKTAVVGALFIAFSPFHIFFSQELRQYSLACFFAALSWYFLLDKRKIGFIISTVFGLYTMYLYPFIILAQWMYIFVEERKYLKAINRQLLAAGLFFLPWFPFFLGQLSTGTSLTYSLPGWGKVVSTSPWKTLPLTISKFVVGQEPISGNLPVLLFSITVIGLFSFAAYKCLHKERNHFLLYWVFIPILGACLLSLIVPVVAPKRLMIVLPAVMIIFALLVQRVPKSYSIFILTCILGVEIFGISMYWSKPALQREPWREIISEIESNSSQRQSAVLFSFPEAFAPWRWYAKGEVKSIVTGKLHLVSLSDIPSNLISDSVEEIYVFDYLRDLSDPSRFINVHLHDQGWEQRNIIDGKALGFVFVYRKVAR